MREVQRATLILESGKPRYNPETGRMEGKEPQEIVVPCFVSDMGIELKNQLLDNKSNVDAKIMRANVPITQPIASVNIGGKKYYVINRKGFFYRRSAIYLSEVNND
ncbi:hypothetical protein [Streptococcus gallolyticus]|uniref:hypothetical protein n=1 Tax=Streptococcus gallolyticus TaxID=315405 RepID=UPI0001E0F2C1|nr:hypothetical protein [Streptococcus gallolyticus]EFM30291.1 hypothetical protein HMPREF9352_0405 [Streptococcus gallolyticus subsp. gallolyticus TX20005]QKI01140.1 hypothetical protein FOC63_06305 [Streptococcus gallolyticus]QWX87211.1 hypothetical protein JGX27_02395 [Streptococcus gallolyticus subsp. gallolyticus TX20005]